MRKYIGYLFLFLFVSQIRTAAQEIPKDMWLWSTISLDKKLTRKLSITFDEELRLFDNISRVNLFFSNLGVSYKYGKKFKFALVYRFISKNQDGQPYSKRHRLYVDASYKNKLKKLEYSYRLRVQGQVKDYYSSESGRIPESFMRHKFEFDYSLKKFSPYFAAEFFYQFYSPSFHPGDRLWDRTRWYLGSKYELNRDNSFDLFYMFEHNFNVKNPGDGYAIGVQFSHSF